MSLKRFFGCVLQAFFLSELATVSQRVVRGRALSQLRCIELLHSHVREAASLLHKKPRQKQITPFLVRKGALHPMCFAVFRSNTP